MKIIYVDGGGGIDSKYCYFDLNTNKARIVHKKGLTNNQAEYSAILRALVDYQDCREPIKILSDSLNTINQLNHKFAINNEQLRKLAQQVWNMIPQMGSKITFVWIPRNQNIAGKLIE